MGKKICRRSKMRAIAVLLSAWMAFTTPPMQALAQEYVGTVPDEAYAAPDTETGTALTQETEPVAVSAEEGVSAPVADESGSAAVAETFVMPDTETGTEAAEEVKQDALPAEEAASAPVTDEGGAARESAPLSPDDEEGVETAEDVVSVLTTDDERGTTPEGEGTGRPYWALGEKVTIDPGMWTFKKYPSGVCVITGLVSDTGSTLVIPNRLNGMTVQDVSVRLSINALETLYLPEKTPYDQMIWIEDCPNLSSIHLYNEDGVVVKENCLPETIKTIDYNTFNGTAIEELTLPGVTRVKTYTKGAFEGCCKLRTITFGKAAVIDGMAFSRNTGSEAAIGDEHTTCTVNYPGKISDLPWDVSLYSPNLVFQCSDGACGFCGDAWDEKNMKKLYDGSCTHWSMDNDGNLTVDSYGSAKDLFERNRGAQIVKSRLWDDKKVKKATIKQVSSINNSAFRKCTGLTGITLSEGLTSIGDRAFEDCTGLTSITLPEGLTSIGLFAFEGCSGLTGITLPEGLTSIGLSAFEGCTGLTSITLPEGLTSIENKTFWGCNGLTGITLPKGLTSIENSGFAYCRGLTGITLPEGLTSIGRSAFIGCSGLTGITLPEGLTSIENNTFSRCSDLTDITIPGNVVYIGEAAFYGCSSLKDLYFDGPKAQWEDNTKVVKGFLWNYGVPSDLRIHCRATVTFDTMGRGKAPEPQKVWSGEGKAVKPEVERMGDGFGVAAWYTDRDCTTPWDFDSVVTDDMTLYAGWTPVTEAAVQLKSSGPIDGIYTVDSEDAAQSGTVCLGGRKWRIIGEADDAWLLISDEAHAEKDWEAAKAYCTDLYGSFTEAEKEQIVRITKEDADYDEVFGAADLKDAPVFLLSAAEADWYFEDKADRMSKDAWWLRSPRLDSSGAAAMVAQDGALSGDTASLLHGVRPAFVLDRDRVLFTSNGAGEKSSAEAGSGVFGEFKAWTWNARKLTLLDESRNGFEAELSEPDQDIVLPGMTLPISYRGAATGTGEYVSAMLCDEEDEPLFYASLTPAGTGAGIWELTLPDSLEANGSYTLRVFSEKQNPGNLTDVASPMEEIFLDVADYRSGTLGSGIKWLLADGILRISGTGAIPVLNSKSAWHSYRDEIEEVHIGEGITAVGSNAFMNCPGLMRVVFADTVQEIGIGAFYNCPELDRVSLPKGLEKMERFNFSKCGSLKSIFIPRSLTTIYIGTFSDVLLEHIYYEGTEEEWKDLTKEIVIPEAEIHYGSVDLPIEEPSVHTHHASCLAPDRCIECGRTVKDAVILHDYRLIRSRAGHSYICVDCGQVQVELSHYTACTDPDAEFCDYCGYPLKGAVFEKGIHTGTIDDVTEEGGVLYHERNCLDCGEKLLDRHVVTLQAEKMNDALVHSMVCADDGYVVECREHDLVRDEATGEIHCADCGEVLVELRFDTGEGSSIDSMLIVKGGQAEKPGDPTLDGYLFAGWYEDEALTTAWDFSNAVTENRTLYAKWTGKTKEPTCTEPGIRTYTYEWGESHTEEIPALGHHYKEEITKEPTTTVEGVRTFTCTRCGDSYTESIPMLNGDLRLYEKVGNKPELRLSKKLKVNSSFTLVPQFADGKVVNARVVWTSSNPDVAAVTQDGKVTARIGGKTLVTVRSEENPELTAYCEVFVSEPVTGIELDKKSYTFGTGESVTLTAAVLPFTAEQNLVWSTSNAELAVVCDEKGQELSGTMNGKQKIYEVSALRSVTVKALKAGSARVTAQAADGSGKKATCSFTIGNPVPDFTISGKNNAKELAAGKTLAMQVNWSGEKPKNANVSWSLKSADGGDASHIAAISDKGVLTGVSEGTVTVTATSMANPEKKDAATIVVYVPVKSVTLNATSGIVSMANSSNGLQLSVNVLSTITGQEPTGVTLGTAPTVAYSIEPQYAENLTVDKDGLIIAGAKTGRNIPVKVTVKAYDGYKKTLTCRVTVLETSPLKGIKLNKTRLSIGEGSTASLTASLNPLNPDGETGITWDTSAPSIVTVDQNGNLTAHKAGTATITVTAEGTVLKNAKETHPSATCKVTVTPSVTGISFTNVSTLESNGLATGKSFAIKTELILSGNGRAAGTELLWTSSDESVAEVSSRGVVKAKQPGTVTITAVSKDTKEGNAKAPSASVTFAVHKAVTKVQLDKTKLTLGTQEGTQYGLVSIAKILPADATDPAITWTANNQKVSLAAIYAGASPSAGSFSAAGTGVRITTKSGDALAVKALEPGVVKLTGITMDGSNKKVTCTVTVRGQVTGLSLKTNDGGNGYNDVTEAKEKASISGGDSAVNTHRYTSIMMPGTSMTLTPILAINGVENAGTTRKLWSEYKKYTDVSLSWRSSDTSVATVNKNGKISVKKETKGKTVTICAASADGQQTAELVITVE